MRSPPEARRADPAARTVTEKARVARAAAVVGAGIFLSRLFGFVRERVFAHWFGAGDLADAWRAALRLPNVLQNLLGEGTLSASLIPVYADLLEQGREEEAGRFAGAALGILTAVAACLALGGILLAPVLVKIFFFDWSPEKQALTVTLARV
ncbi:MAG: murein biosynthesis integral membrane protein MurJ, partial [Gemmatimonadetes bacterium]|nr:murein biosynthesis integral membrane protein MurJ [Gemmatimonadota bacterium]